MKINNYFGVLLTAGLALTACSSDDSNTEQVYRTYTMTIDATKGANEAASRATTRALTLTGSTLNATWATTERVYVQGKKVSDNSYFWFEGSLQPHSAGTTTQLNGVISLPTSFSISIDDAIGTPHKLTLQFPRPYILDYTGQIGTLADIAAKYDYAKAEEVMVDIEADKVVGVSPVTFVNQQAIVKFTLKDKADGTTLLNPTALTIQYGEESLSLTSIPSTTYGTNGNGVLYVAIPGFSDKAVTLTATVADATYTFTKSGITFVNKKEARERLGLPQDRRIILFASQRVTMPLKGMDYLIDACRQLAEGKSQESGAPSPCIVILGGHAEEITGQLPLDTFPLGYINDEQRIVDVYNAADVFVLPSLSENLPNTIMEAMACGLPCVGFKVGGIPEEIDHKRNGYVAEYRSAEDLARGIQWILNEADYESLSRNAIQKVAHNYSQQSVALRYAEVYQQAMAFKHYKL